MKGGCTTFILKNPATSGIEPDLTAHEAIVTTFTPYRFEDFTLSVKHNTNKETRTLKGLLPLLLKRRLFTKFQHVRQPGKEKGQAPRGLEPLKKVLTVLCDNHSAMAPIIFNCCTVGATRTHYLHSPNMATFQLILNRYILYINKIDIY